MSKQTKNGKHALRIKQGKAPTITTSIFQLWVKDVTEPQRRSQSVIHIDMQQYRDPTSKRQLRTTRVMCANSFSAISAVSVGPGRRCGWKQ